MSKKELQERIDKLIIELNRVAYMSNFATNPLEYDAIYQKAIQIEREIQRLQYEKWNISGKCIEEE